MFDKLKGYRTYAVAVVTFTLGGLMALGYPIPVEVFTILGALGLTTLRAAIK